MIFRVSSSQSGAVMIEAALVLPLFFFFIISSLETVLYVFTWNMRQYAVERTARTAIVNQALSTDGIKQILRDELAPSGALASRVRNDQIEVCSGVAVQCASESRVGNYVSIIVSSRFHFTFLPFELPMNNVVMMRNE